MEIEFASAQLERCSQDYRMAVREWGVSVARRYQARIRLLRGATSFSVLRSNPSLRLHRLLGRRQGQFAIDLTERWRLIVVRGEAANRLVIMEVTQHYDC